MKSKPEVLGAPKSLQALQFGIDSLSLDEALAAVNLAKIELDKLREKQNEASSSVASANQNVLKAEARSLF
jgi:FtsZ-binding cell division protein ZapB